MITIYSKDDCPQCRVALQMVRAKGLDHTVKKLSATKTDDAATFTKEELLKIVPGARVMPQIFHDDSYIGSTSDLQMWIAQNVRD